jgi:hypothetical protein
MRSIRLLLALAAVFLSVSSAAAQAVRGVVVEGDDSQPVEGMVVSLHPSGGGAALSGGLTNAEGRFVVRAPGPGRYMVRAERVGYRRVEVDVEVVDSEPAEVRLATGVEAFVLPPMQVTSDSRCVVRPGAGLQAYDLWEQAAVALRATALAQDRELVEYTVRTYTSEVAGMRTRRRRDDPRRVTGNPFQTLSPGALAKRGYMAQDASSVSYFGPDAAVLLSDEFMDTHCLSVQRTGGERGHIGVAFEPVEGRNVVDIRGTLWLDARTGELRHVDYVYTELPGSPHGSSSGGRIEFQRQRSGAWVVRRWSIRTSQVQQERARASGELQIAVDIREAGGEVTDVRVTDVNVTGEFAEP